MANSQETNVNLKINRVPDKATLEDMIANNQIQPNQLYMLPSELGSGVVTMQTKVLWENSSPTSDFAAQDIIVSDISKYQYYCIIYLTTKTENFTLNTGLIPIKKGTFLGTVHMYTNNQSSNVSISRRVNISDNTFTFTSAYKRDSTSNSVENNNRCVPYQIIGIKLIESPTQITNKYSTEETVVGEWIDGKKIYRKVVNFGAWTISSTVSSKSTSISNIDEVISCKIFRKLNTDWFTTFNDVAVTIKPNGDVEMLQSSSVSWTDVYIILEYTKTTD